MRPHKYITIVFSHKTFSRAKQAGKLLQIGKIGNNRQIKYLITDYWIYGTYVIQNTRYRKLAPCFYLGRLPKPKIVKNIADIRNRFVEKGVRVIFTSPAMIGSDKFNMEDARTRQSLNYTQKIFAQYDIYLVGNMADFLHDVSAFFNSKYHLKPDTAKVHSQKLAQTLKSYLAE